MKRGKLSWDKLIQLVIVLAVIVIVILLSSFFNPLVGWIKEIDLFGENEPGNFESVIDQLQLAYQSCISSSEIAGQDCLCDSGVVLNFEEESQVEIMAGSSGGVQFESSSGVVLGNVDVDNVKYCFQTGLDDKPGRTFLSVSIVKDGSKNKPEYRWVTSETSGDLKGTLKLYRHVEGEGSDAKIFLCFPNSDIPFKECAEIERAKKVCSNYLCAKDEYCLAGKEDKNYEGEGVCCTEPCRNLIKEREAKNLFIEASNLISEGKTNEAISKLTKIELDYKDTTLWDDAMFSHGRILGKIGGNALQLYENLIFTQYLNRDNDFGDKVSLADSESRNYLSQCGDWVQQIVWTRNGKITGPANSLENEYECMARRDTILNSCYYSKKWYGGECKPCENVKCSDLSLTNRDSCELSACVYVGQNACSWEEKWYGGRCVLSGYPKSCVSITDANLCGSAICITESGLDRCCEWNGDFCEEIESFK